jgi:uroporphyrin-III C-methyltransferase
MIPLTRRLTARRVQFVTGHDIAGTLPQDLNMAALADPLATTVIYMPKRTFPVLAKRLFAAGLPHDTPAMLAENVSRPEQTLLRDSMQVLAERLENDVSSAPGLILYGSLAGAP